MGLDTYLSHGSNMTHDKDSNQLDRSPGLVVMGDDSCSIGVGSNPGTVYWMDVTFFHIDLLSKFV